MMENIETLSDWKTALRQGASIESLLGLGSQKKKKDKKGNNEDSIEDKMVSDDFKANLTVKEINGTSLSFHLCCPQLSTVDPSVANHVLVTPPSIPVSQLVAPIFIGVQEVGKTSIDQK